MNSPQLGLSALEGTAHNTGSGFISTHLTISPCSCDFVPLLVPLISITVVHLKRYKTCRPQVDLLDNLSLFPVPEVQTDDMNSIT
jgi:hypothetical protein